MEDHKDQILDLIGDESFVRWVVDPNIENKSLLVKNGF